MTLLIVGLVLFLGIHCVRLLVPQWREAMIERLGAGPWKGIYSIAALAGLALIIWGYGIARQEPEFLYTLPQGTTHLAALLMLISIVLLVSSDLPVGRIKQAVKHPLLIGVKIWAFAHLLVNGDVASVLLFGALLVWAVIALIRIKRRGEPAPVAKSSWSDAVAIVGGIAVWALIMFWLHEWLIGVAPIA